MANIDSTSARARWKGLVNRRLPLAADKILLAVALVLALGSVVSWRYHFFFQNYSRFVVEQVLPKERYTNLLPKVLEGHVDPNAPQLARLDTYPYNSPYFFSYGYNGSISLTGSDYLTVWYFLKTVLEKGNPYKSVGHAMWNRDFPGMATLRNDTVPDQEIGTGMSYFPGAPWLVLPFYSSNYLASFGRYLAFFKLFFIGASALVVKQARAHRGALALLFGTLYFTCYPIDFMLDRGNTEGIVLMLVVGFYVAYLSGRSYLAATLLAAAATAKLFPALLFVHFLFDRRYRPLAAGVLAFCALIGIALLPMHAPLPVLLTQFRDNFSGHQTQTLYFSEAYRFSQSFFSFLTAGLSPKSILLQRPWVATLARVYPLVCFGILGGLLWRMRRLDFEHRVLVVTAAMVFLPQNVLAYHLVHMLVPFGLLAMKVAKSDVPLGIDALLLLLCAALFVAKEYLVYMFGLEWGLSILLNPLLLAAMLVVGSLRTKEDAAPRALEVREETERAASLPA